MSRKISKNRRDEVRFSDDTERMIPRLHAVLQVFPYSACAFAVATGVYIASTRSLSSGLGYIAMGGAVAVALKKRGGVWKGEQITRLRRAGRTDEEIEGFGYRLN